ncbi:MAG: hypothetical protein HGA44_06345 [Cellulomonadaceae bacterium]|nr:hypothetical protein [Cellulomonadaceae bacterium]
MSATPGSPPGRPATAVGGPHAWPVWPRVQLGKRARITLTDPGSPPDTLGRDLVSELFALGLQVRDEGPGDGDATLELALKGHARFLVGQVDLGSKRGLQAIARGMAYVLDHVVLDRARKAAEGMAARATGLGSSPEPERTEMVSMPLTLAQADIERVAERVRDGAHVVLIDEAGERAAVLVSWGWYARQEQRLAGAQAAYWRAWRSGCFDTTGYAAELLASGMHPAGPPEPTTHAGAAPLMGTGDGDDVD